MEVNTQIEVISQPQSEHSVFPPLSISILWKNVPTGFLVS